MEGNAVNLFPTSPSQIQTQAPADSSTCQTQKSATANNNKRPLDAPSVTNYEFEARRQEIGVPNLPSHFHVYEVLYCPVIPSLTPDGFRTVKRDS